MRLSLLVTLGLLLLPAMLMADPPAEPPAPEDAAADEQPLDLFAIMTRATEDQRARMRRFLDNRYPDLGPDLYAMLQARHPGMFSWAGEEVRAIILTRHPRLGAAVERELSVAIAERCPHLREEIANLVHEKYPELVEALDAAGPEVDPASEMARLIREKHRALLDDVLSLLRDRHPDLLEYVHERVTAEHPTLILDVAEALMVRYPGIGDEVAGLLGENYPDLLPGLLAILTEESAPEPLEDEGPLLDDQGEPMDEPGDV